MQLIMTGNLHSHGTARHTLFKVEREDFELLNARYLVTQISAITGEEIAKATLDTMAEVGTWLENHQDW